MSAPTFTVYNGPAPTTAALVKVATGTSIKTLLQVATASTVGLRVVEWGISFDAVAAVPVECELIQTDVAATVTAYAAGDVVKSNSPNDPASTIQLGTALSGYTATAEGTTAASRLLDYQLVSQQYVKQFPLGREPAMPVSKFLRVRVTSAQALNALAYITWEE